MLTITTQVEIWIWRGRRTTRYNVYRNQLNRQKRVEILHPLKSQSRFLKLPKRNGANHLLFQPQSPDFPMSMIKVPLIREKWPKLSRCTYLFYTFLQFFDLKWNAITNTFRKRINNTGVVSFIRIINVEDCKFHVNFRCCSIIWVGIFSGIIVVVSWSFQPCSI